MTVLAVMLDAFPLEIWASARNDRRLAGARRVFATVVAHDRGFSLHDGGDADRSLPDPDQRAQGLLGVVSPQIDSLVLVLQEQLTAVLEVGVLHVDERV